MAKALSSRDITPEVLKKPDSSLKTSSYSSKLKSSLINFLNFFVPNGPFVFGNNSKTLDISLFVSKLPRKTNFSGLFQRCFSLDKINSYNA